MDLFVTCAKLAGAAGPTDRPIDGQDIAPLLFGSGTITRPPFLYYRGATLYAARLGPWKAHYLTRTGYGPDKPVLHHPPALYHLGRDPGERFDVATNHLDVVARIQLAVDAERAAIQPAPSQLIKLAE